MPAVMRTRFPIFCIRAGRLLSAHSLSGMWEYLAWSANVMYQGTFPAAGFRGSPSPSLGTHQKAGAEMYGGRRLRLIELRGDWEHHANTFRLTHYYACKNICHLCGASRDDDGLSFTDFRANPVWKSTLRSHAQFLAEEIGEPLNCLIYVAGFNMNMIRFDTMHTVNLGCGLFSNGSGFYELMKLGWFAGSSKPEKFIDAYRKFRSFTRKHKIDCSQPQFKPWMLVNGVEEYCFLASKATCSSCENFMYVMYIYFNLQTCCMFPSKSSKSRLIIRE